MDLETLVRKMSEIRKYKEFITNSFFSVQQLSVMLDMDHVAIELRDNAIFILMEEDQLFRLYFYAADLASLQQIQNVLPGVKGKPILADIIGRNKQAENIINRLQLYNFHKYSTLIRMKRPGLERRDIEVSPVILASEDRLDEIMNLLYLEFDINISHLPNRNKLLRALQNNEITLVIQQNEIAGLAYFERLGEKLIYLYQLVVDKRFRGQGIADRLLTHQFNQISEDVICQLWVESNNHFAIHKYEEHHFSPDGLFDSIMMFKGEDNNE